MKTSTFFARHQFLTVVAILLVIICNAQSVDNNTVSHPKIEKMLNERLTYLKGLYPESFARINKQEMEFFCEEEMKILLSNIESEDELKYIGVKLDEPPSGNNESGTIESDGFINPIQKEKHGSSIDNSRVSLSDSLALVDLFISTNGVAWTNRSNWLTGNVSTWYGVTVLNNRVNTINLTNNHLVGYIPNSIGDLTMLTKLWMNSNQISGIIPSSIGNLTQLLFLYLDNNLLESQIPLEICTNLTNLNRFSMHSNYFGQDDCSVIQCLIERGGWTYFLYNFPQKNGFVFMNDCIQTYGVTTQANPISGGITSGDGTFEVGEAVTVVAEPNLGWYFTNWTEAGVVVSTQESFTFTITTNRHLIANFITGLQRDSLVLVDLYNSTNGTNWINKANWLTGRLNTWHGITISSNRVIMIQLGSNNLSGSIPENIGNLYGLQALYLYSNQLSGSIPSSIGSLINLQILSLRNNQLTGEIPEEIGNLTLLQSVYLFNNQLIGGIPDEIGNLSNLVNLHLYFNQLTGSIPVSFSNLTNLQSLWLNNNQLESSIDRKSVV